jgi:uncharacterized protein
VLPPACVEAISGADLLLHAGDVSTREALSEIERIGPPVRAIHGNVDSLELRRALPAELELRLGGATIAVVHDPGPARGRLERLRARFPKADAVIFGHTHLPEHRAVAGFQIFNPGSPTERRRAPHRSMGLAEVREGRIAFRHLPLAPPTSPA